MERRQEAAAEMGSRWWQVKLRTTAYAALFSSPHAVSLRPRVITRKVLASQRLCAIRLTVQKREPAQTIEGNKARATAKKLKSSRRSQQ